MKTDTAPPQQPGQWKENPQKAAVRRQKAHGESLRAWLQDRAQAAAKRRAERRKAAAKKKPAPRGVDRVPARLRVHVPAPEVLVQLEPVPRMRTRPVRLRERRARRLSQRVAFVESRLKDGEFFDEAKVRRWTR